MFLTEKRRKFQSVILYFPELKEYILQVKTVRRCHKIVGLIGFRMIHHTAEIFQTHIAHSKFVQTCHDPPQHFMQKTIPGKIKT